MKKLQEKHLTNEELYDRIIKLLKRNRMRISRKTENSDERNQKVLKKEVKRSKINLEVFFKVYEKIGVTSEIQDIGEENGEYN